MRKIPKKKNKKGEKIFYTSIAWKVLIIINAQKFSLICPLKDFQCPNKIFSRQYEFLLPISIILFLGIAFSSITFRCIWNAN